MKKNKRITQAFFIYWLLLIYIVAALIWWFISLEKQSKERYQFEIQSAASSLDNTNSASYETKVHNYFLQKKRRTTKHISEGLTFFIVIIIGAIFIYRAVKKQLKINKQQQNFIMAVTHELKTPIAIAKLNLETLQKRKLEDNQQQKLIQTSIIEMHRLNDLTNNILIVSQIETGDYKMNKESIELDTFLEKLLIEIKEQHPNRIIQNTFQSNATIIGDQLLLKLAITNIIDNALKYSGKEDILEVDLIHKNNLPIMVIKDQGIGISNEDKIKVFEKFYRVGNEITRNKKGTGLGLYLTKKILNDHKATISISDNKPKGSIFTIQFLQ